jgi:hypothetical protein
MHISCKDIVLAALAKAIARLAQCVVSKTSYCVNRAKQDRRQVT